MALSLLHLELNAAIALQIKERNLPELARLIGRRSWVLEQLEHIAREKVKTLRFVDEIEVYLAYPIKLKKKLGIPACLDSMLYFKFSSVTEADLNFAAELVSATIADKVQYIEWLVNNSQWQRALQIHCSEKFVRIEKARDESIDKDDCEKAHAKYKDSLRKLTEEVLEGSAHLLWDWKPSLP